MSMTESRSVTLAVAELDGESHAEACLAIGGEHRLCGTGKARRNPADPNVTEIGEEIAIARALSDLAHKLLDAAAAQIETVTHERAKLHL